MMADFYNNIYDSYNGGYGGNSYQSFNETTKGVGDERTAVIDRKVVGFHNRDEVLNAIITLNSVIAAFDAASSAAALAKEEARIKATAPIPPGTRVSYRSTCAPDETVYGITAAPDPKNTDGLYEGYPRVWAFWGGNNTRKATFMSRLRVSVEA